MAKKKDQQIPISQEDEAQVQSLLAQVHQIAKELHSSTNQPEAEAALSAITGLSEGAQMAMLKALSRERHIDAADILIAINELSPIKEIRKEARRSVIRLEQERIYPQWEAPIVRPPAFVMQNLPASSNPPRFWKGIVTDSRDAGEMQLLLFWEQGEDYRDVRILGFLLEFWHDGVKDFFTATDNKRGVDRLLEETMEKVKVVDCSLAKGRRMILEALEVNKKYGTRPQREYRLHTSLVNQLVLEVPGIEEVEVDDSPYIDPNLEPDQIATGFIDAWADGDYKFVYHLLSDDSSIREGLTEQEWVERRKQWAAQAHPARLKASFLHEREPQQTGIWLPNPLSRGRTSPGKEVETGWSLELDDTSSTLPELPQATAVYKETGRHWFWTNFTFVQAENGWRIQNITDGGTNAQGLSIAELQKRIKEHNKAVENITRHHQPTDPDADQYMLEIIWRTVQSIYYDDALLKHLPFDQSVYLDASSRATMMGDFERGLVYLERMAHQFPEQRGETLRQIAALQLQLSERFLTEEDEEFEDEDDEKETEEERGERFEELAKATLQESLEVDNSATGHVLLAELLINSGDEEELDEAEDHLLRAQELPTSQVEETLIETKLGEVYLEREHYEQALAHFQRVLEIDPNFASAWHNIGDVYQMLENNEEAIAAFKRSIELHPEDIDSYAHIVEIYSKEGRLPEARDLLEQGLTANPDSAYLLAVLSSTYLDTDLERAEELLEKAEEIDPDMMMVRLYRQILDMRKKEQRPQQPVFHGKKRRKK